MAKENYIRQTVFMVIAFSVSFPFYFSILKGFFDILVMSRGHQGGYLSRRFKGEAMAKQRQSNGSMEGILVSGRGDSEIMPKDS